MVHAKFQLSAVMLLSILVSSGALATPQTPSAQNNDSAASKADSKRWSLKFQDEAPQRPTFDEQVEASKRSPLYWPQESRKLLPARDTNPLRVEELRRTNPARLEEMQRRKDAALRLEALQR